jgi:hypothetical protein
MKPGMDIAGSELTKLADGCELTAGMYVRVHGDNLILGRRAPVGPSSELEEDDRVRLTRLNASTYGLSVKRHTGRWEKTPFSGNIKEMFEVISTFMQHLVADY